MASPEDDVSSDGTSAIGDNSFSYLGDLADKVRGRQSPAQPEDEDGESGDSADSDDSAATEDPLEMVRKLFAERGPNVAPRPGPEISTKTRRKMVFLGMTLTISLLLTGVLMVSDPEPRETISDQDRAALDDPLATIALSADDAAFMNRVFMESSHEVAYCGILDTDANPSQMKVWLADTIRASPGKIQFRTSNCPTANLEVLLHTHPNGGLGLSETDRATLQDQPEEYMCVQAGEISEEPGTELSNLACYYGGDTEDEGYQPVRVPVVIAES